jgi:hypothetical protein
VVARLSVRTVTTLLKVMRLGLVVALPVVALGFLVSAPDAEPEQLAKTPHATAAAPIETRRELAWYAPLWERDLRQPPIPPAPAPEPTQPVTPSEAPRLVATFVDERSRFAHLMDRDGKLLFKEINDEIGGYRVAAIEPGRVELATGTRTLWIEVPKGQK